MAGPLEGLRVLDFGHYLAGPLAGVFLADQGADVLRVVSPRAPAWDAIAEQTLARGKRMLVADLTDPAQRARVLELAAGCDVVIENFRPGVMDRLGIGYEAVRKRNPAVVYVSMPGYSRHHARARERVWDATISAGCGLFTDLSVAGAGLGLPPTYTSLPLPSVYAGLWGAIAAVAALHGRHTSGTGDWIEAPLADAAMSAAAGILFGIADQPARYNAPPLPRAVLDRISLSRLPAPLAKRVHALIGGLMPPFFRNYRCADGELLFICAIDNANQIAKLIDAAGVRAEVEALGFRDGDVLDVPPTKDNLNAYRGASRRWRSLGKLLADCFASDTADQWAERLSRAGVPAARQRTTAEWVRDEVMLESGVLLVAGDVVQPAPQVDVRGETVETAMPAPPPDGGSEWRGERTFAPSEEETSPPTAPLAGVRVLDLANVIAGPAAGRTLAELGAEVTHVSAAEPRMGPRMNLVLGLEVNQGKRSVALDARSPGGREVLGRMLPGADVVLYNKLPQQAERLGVAPDQVHAVNPRAVVSAVTAYGGVQAGGWEDRPAYDPVVQALTGVMRRFGGDAAPAVHGIASCIDYFTGFAAAYGAIVGLLARQQGATHLVARTSLVRTAGWVQLPFVGHSDGDEASGLDARGPSPSHRLYRTADGWVQVVFGRAPNDLERALRRLPTPDALARVRSLGGDAQEVNSARRLRRSARLGDPAVGLRITEHPAGERIFVTDAAWLQPLRAPRRRLTPAPRPGQHTRQILGELGYAPAEITALEAEVAVSAGWRTGPTYAPR